MLARLWGSKYTKVTLVGLVAVVGLVYLVSVSTDHVEIADTAPSQIESTENTVAASNVASTSTSQTSTVYPPRQTYVAWEHDQSRDYRDLDTFSRVPDHASFVRLDGKFDQWLLGSPIELYIPQTDQFFSAIVDEIKPNGPGSTIVRASASEGEDIFERMILTFGPGHTMAYIATTKDNWEVNGNDELAWVVSSSKLQISRDYSMDDVRHRDTFRYANAEYVPRATD